MRASCRVRLVELDRGLAQRPARRGHLRARRPRLQPLQRLRFFQVREARGAVAALQRRAIELDQRRAGRDALPVGDVQRLHAAGERALDAHLPPRRQRRRQHHQALDGAGAGGHGARLAVRARVLPGGGGPARRERIQGRGQGRAQREGAGAQERRDHDRGRRDARALHPLGVAGEGLVAFLDLPVRRLQPLVLPFRLPRHLQLAVLQVAQLGHVAEHTDHRAPAAAVVAEVGGHRRHQLRLRPGAGAQGHRPAHPVRRSLHRLQHHLGELVEPLAGDECLTEAAAHHLARADVEDALGRRVHQLDRAPGADDDHPVVQALQYLVAQHVSRRSARSARASGRAACRASAPG